MKNGKTKFEFSIQSVIKPNGDVSFHAASFNDGVQNEIIITMMRMWLKGAENAYFEHF